MNNYKITFKDNVGESCTSVQSDTVERAIYLARVRARALLDNFNVDIISVIKEVQNNE